MIPTKDDDAARQAECIVHAIDAYLATFPWPAPTISSTYTTADNPMTKARALLVATFAGTIRMSEPRKSPMQR